jgi:hypothetical protein|tara:strand:+ start:630 stop:983 length:354 start_codon:yes stop_codon:yes gene_type:complete
LNNNFDKDVNHPAHYNLNEYGIECIDAIQASMTLSGFENYLKGNIIKYLWRCNYKGNKLTDLHKAKWYLAKLIHIQEDDDDNGEKVVVTDQMDMYADLEKTLTNTTTTNFNVTVGAA